MTPPAYPTARQLEVLRYVRDYARRGYPPSIRDICRHFGWTSLNAPEQHLRALERKGMVERSGDKSRGLTLTKAGKRAVGIPLVDMSEITGP